MHISVTKDDIAKGERCNPLWCPIAISAIRSLAEEGLPTDVLVASGTIFYRDNNSYVEDYFRLPKEAIQFMDDFDAGQDVDPIEFEVHR